MSSDADFADPDWRLHASGMPTGTRRRARISELELTAFHEAGHAVVSYLVHRGIRALSIVPDSETLGRLRCCPHPPSFKPDVDASSCRARMRIEADALVFLAGGEAESLRAGRARYSGAHVDHTNAVRIVEHMCGSTREVQACVELLRIRARAMLRQPLHWRAVRMLAMALLKRRELRPREVRQIIREGITIPWSGDPTDRKRLWDEAVRGAPADPEYKEALSTCQFTTSRRSVAARLRSRSSDITPQ